MEGICKDAEKYNLTQFSSCEVFYYVHNYNIQYPGFPGLKLIFPGL